jgi:hypothetical protein
MIKLKNILREVSQEEWEKWRISDEYKEWRKSWLERHNATFDNKGRLIAYHGTTPNRVKLIKQTGFNNRSNFSLKKDYSRHWGIVVLKVGLPLDAIDFCASDIHSIRRIGWEEVI